MTRKSRREIDRTIERLEYGPGGVPDVSLAEMIAADEIEDVDGRPDLIRLDGQVYRRLSVRGVRE